MQKFIVDDFVFITDGMPDVLVIKENLPQKELAEKIQEYTSAYQNYFDKQIKMYKEYLEMFGVTEENYKLGGFMVKGYYENIVRFRKLKETYKPSVVFAVPKMGGVDATIKYVKENLEGLKAQGAAVEICFQFLDESMAFNDEGRLPAILSAEEFEKMKKLENFLNRNGFSNVSVKEGLEATSLSLDEVENANKFIKVVANKIKDMNLTPFEASVYIHDFCSQFFYNDKDKKYGTNVLAEVVASGNIRCVGYSTMFKAIVDELNMPGLSAKLACCFESRKDGHAVNIVSVEDEKYGVSGEYMEDSCRSALIEEQGKSDFGYCLFPVDDIDNMYTRGERFISSTTMQSYYGLGSKEFDIGLDKMSEDEMEEFFEREGKLFDSSFKKKGKTIEIEKYAMAYYECLIKQGIPEKQAKQMVDDKINYSIAVISKKVKETSTSPFFRADISDEFLQENMTEMDYIYYTWVDLKKELKECEDPKRKEELVSKIGQLEHRYRELLSQMKKPNERNLEIIEKVLE